MPGDTRPDVDGNATAEVADADGHARVDADGTGDRPSETLDPVDETETAFATLGNVTRLRAIAALDEHEPRSFSALAEASGADTTAGFAYHLRQLRDRYVRSVSATTDRDAGEDDADGYVLTEAGRRVARAIRAGAYTESVDHEPIAIADPCPFCAEHTLTARARDNTVTVGCRECERSVLRLPLGPGAFDSHEPAALPAALSAQYRGRVAMLSDGVCPECGGAAETRIEPAAPVTDVSASADAGATADDGDGDDADAADGAEPPRRPATCRLACASCGYELRVPTTLAVLDHPAVVAFYHDHGIDVRDRPVWNVGEEFRERVLSTKPLAVRVSTTVDGDGLALFVAGDGRVVETERFEPTEPERQPTADGVDGDSLGETGDVTADG